MTQVTVYNTTDTPLPLETCTVYGKEEKVVDSSDAMLALMVNNGYLIVRDTSDTKSKKRSQAPKPSADATQSAPTPGEHQESTEVTGKEN